MWSAKSTRYEQVLPPFFTSCKYGSPFSDDSFPKVRKAHSAFLIGGKTFWHWMIGEFIAGRTLDPAVQYKPERRQTDIWQAPFSAKNQAALFDDQLKYLLAAVDEQARILGRSVFPENLVAVARLFANAHRIGL